jgi:hypothetical protein
MRFDPTRPIHDRYQVEHGFLDAAAGAEVVTIGRVVNAFFRWEFNSCETLVRDGDVHPIDYANASPTSRSRASTTTSRLRSPPSCAGACSAA